MCFICLMRTSENYSYFFVQAVVFLFEELRKTELKKKSSFSTCNPKNSFLLSSFYSLPATVCVCQPGLIGLN